MQKKKKWYKEKKYIGMHNYIIRHIWQFVVSPLNFVSDGRPFLQLHVLSLENKLGQKGEMSPDEDQRVVSPLIGAPTLTSKCSCSVLMVSRSLVSCS